jgi:hypothetical protein
MFMFSISYLSKKSRTGAIFLLRQKYFKKPSKYGINLLTRTRCCGIMPVK